MSTYACGCFFFFQAEDGIRDLIVTGVQTCALPISHSMFGTGLLVGGIALATLPALAGALGVGMALLGADVIARAATDRGLIIAWRSRGRRRHQLMRGESTTRSLRRSA